MYMTLNYQIKSILNCLSIQYANSVSFFVQLDALPKDEKLVGELSSGLEPYIFEAGLDLMIYIVMENYLLSNYY